MPGQIGTHSYSVEGCVLTMRFVGNVTRDQVVEVYRIAGEILERQGKLFVLSDAREVSSIQFDARRYAFDWMRAHPYNGCVIYGANLLIRTISTLLIRALALVSAHHTPMVLVATEQEAHAWIRAHAEPAPPPPPPSPPSGDDSPGP